MVVLIVLVVVVVVEVVVVLKVAVAVIVQAVREGVHYLLSCHKKTLHYGPYHKKERAP